MREGYEMSINEEQCGEIELEMQWSDEPREVTVARAFLAQHGYSMVELPAPLAVLRATDEVTGETVAVFVYDEQLGDEHVVRTFHSGRADVVMVTERDDHSGARLRHLIGVLGGE